MSRPLAAAAASAAILLALAGCSSGSSGDGRECFEVPAEAMGAIAEGANDVPITPVDAAAVKSKTFEDAYIVAMSFDAPGGDTEVGTWAVASLEEPYDPILAIDGFAHQFTDWPNQMNGHKFNASEDGVDEAKACLEED